jgi:hypothetical protein
MRAFGGLVLTLGAMVLISAPTLAQGPRGGMGRGSLLTNKSVQEELKLSPEQIEKVTKFTQAQMERLGPEFQKLRDLPEAERAEKGAELRKTMTAETNKELKECFKPEQVKRYQEITLQQRGLDAFADGEVAAKLGLSDEQKGKIKDLQANTTKAIQEIREASGNDFQAARPKITAVRKENLDKASALLTEGQKKLWKEMTGEPFEVKFEPRPQAN